MVEIALVALALVNVVFGGWWWWRGGARAGLQAAVAEAAREAAHASERELRTWFDAAARDTRAELARNLSGAQAALLSQAGDAARTQNGQIEAVRAQLAQMQASQAQGLQAATGQLVTQSQAAREGLDQALRRASQAQQEQLQALAAEQQRQLAEMRETVQGRLSELQAGNERRLEQMRLTVDEKLHATLEARLGESFRHVAERLEQVHKGLGEMQVLARDVGSLNRVLSNVKTRGTLGEVQLAGLLEQVFAPDQYAANVETIPGSGARVEYALKLPGRREGGEPVWLPIDAKFPREDYERLLDAQERADPAAAEASARALEKRVLAEARTIRDKYVAPPHTTEVAILFLPLEGLYAEALRRPGLVEALHRDLRVALCGPTTLHATLTSLQMGFRTLALERRSSEVWEVLGAVKTEFGQFGDILARAKKKLAEAQSSLDKAATRTRAMTRQLRSVEALPDDRVQALLGDADAAADADFAVDDEDEDAAAPRAAAAGEGPRGTEAVAETAAETVAVLADEAPGQARP